MGTRENCVPGRGTSPAKGNMFKRRQEFQGSGMEGLARGQVRDAMRGVGFAEDKADPGDGINRFQAALCSVGRKS